MDTKRDRSELDRARNFLLIGLLVFYSVFVGAEFLSLKDPLKSLLEYTAILVLLVCMVIPFLRLLTQQFPQQWADRRWRVRAVVVLATALAIYVALITDAVSRLPRAWTAHHTAIGLALWPAWVGLSWVLVAPSRRRGAAMFAFLMAFYALLRS